MTSTVQILETVQTIVIEPQGIAGPRGKTGATGPQGAQGPPGPLLQRLAQHEVLRLRTEDPSLEQIFLTYYA